MFCHPLKRLLSFALLALASLASGMPVEAQERVWLVPLAEEATIEDLDDGSLFGSPVGLRTIPRGGFVVYAVGSSSFREVSASGDLLWAAGRPGEGPGDFDRPLDYEFDANGNLLILDVEPTRLTVLDSSGAMLDTHRLPQARQIMPAGFASDGWAVMPNVMLNQNADTLWVSRGENSGFSTLSPLDSVPSSIAGEAWAANLKSGEAVVVYRWSSDIVWLSSDGSVRDVTQGVEAISFPEPVPVDVSTQTMRIRGIKVDPAAVAFTQMQPGADSERIYILPLGRTEHARKVCGHIRDRDR